MSAKPGLHRMTAADKEFLEEFLEEHPQFRDVGLGDCYFRAKAELESLRPEEMDRAREYERFMELSLKLATPHIADDDTNWLSKMVEVSGGAEDSLIDFLRRPENAHIAKLPFAEAGAWITAISQDAERELKRRDQERTDLYRAHGCIAPDDAILIGWAVEKVAKKLKAPRIKVMQAIEYLRLQKRRTRKEQRAVMVWDRYCALPEGVCFPDDKTIDALEAELDKKWKSKKPDQIKKAG